MADWHFKHMDALAEIGKHMANSESLIEPHRGLFAEVHALADSLKYGSPSSADERMKQIYGSLCMACRQAELFPCARPIATFYACDLIRTHSP